MVTVRLASILVSVAVLAGCATRLDPESLAPDLAAGPHAPATLTLRVQPIADAPLRRRGLSAVNGEQMRATLIGALRRSNLFRAVVADGEADLILEAAFVSQLDTQGRGESRTEVRREVSVDYELTDARGRTLWAQPVRTVAGSTLRNAYKAYAEASAASVRENVRALVAVAAEQWPRTAENAR